MAIPRMDRYRAPEARLATWRKAGAGRWRSSRIPVSNARPTSRSG